MSDLFFDQGVLKTVTRSSSDLTQPRNGDEVALVYSIESDSTSQNRNLVYTVGSTTAGAFLPNRTLDRIVTSMRRGEKCSVRVAPQYSESPNPLTVEIALLHIRPAVGRTPSTSSAQPVMSPQGDLMDQLMGSSYMQNMMADPNVMNSMMQSNPQMQQLMEQNPELRGLMNDPDFLRQSMEVMRNPNMMREMMRNTDRAMSNIESLPGGSAALHKLYNEVQAPLFDAASGGMGDNDKSGIVKTAAQLKAKYGDMAQLKKPTVEPMINPWAAPAPVPRVAPQVPPMGGFNFGNMNGTSQPGGFDMSSFLQAFQNPMMGMPSRHVQPNQEDLATRYRTQLLTLHAMGFTDRDACLRALERSQGNVERAADLLITERAPNSPHPPSV